MLSEKIPVIDKNFPGVSLELERSFPNPTYVSRILP